MAGSGAVVPHGGGGAGAGVRGIGSAPGGGGHHHGHHRGGSLGSASGAGASGGGQHNNDALGRLLAELCRQGQERRRRGLDDEPAPLRAYVQSEARELGGEPFTRFMGDLYRRIASLLNRSSNHGGILAWAVLATEPPSLGFSAGELEGPTAEPRGGF